MLLLLVALLSHFSILVQLLVICCFGNEESEKSPPSSPPAGSVARSPDKARSPPPEEASISLKNAQKGGKTTDATQQVKVRELSDESQMSKSIKKIDSEYSNEVADPFDVAQLPLPPPEMRNSTRLAAVPS